MNLAARRAPVLLLWLLLALLPLRGWANGWMHLTTGHETVAESAAMPCHGEPAPADDGAVGTHGPSGCNLCDLCHGLALPTTGEATPGDTPRTPWRHADAPPRLPGQPNLFDRPPRA